MRLGSAWSLLRQTVSEWSEDKVPRLGAALAFYTALSIAPLLVLTLRIAAYFFSATCAATMSRMKSEGFGGSVAEANASEPRLLIEKSFASGVLDQLLRWVNHFGFPASVGSRQSSLGF